MWIYVHHSYKMAPFGALVVPSYLSARGSSTGSAFSKHSNAVVIMNLGLDIMVCLLVQSSTSRECTTTRTRFIFTAVM